MRTSLGVILVGLGVGCGGESSSGSSGIDGLGPNATLAPQFTVDAPRSGDGPIGVSGTLYAGGHTQMIPDGRLVVVSGTERSPLARTVERVDNEDYYGYSATLSHAEEEATVSLVLARDSEHVVATTKLSSPISFSIVGAPATIGKSDKLTVEMSRALAADESAMILLRGQCFPPFIARNPTTTGTRAVFALDKLEPTGACEATADLQIDRIGAIDPAFAREIELRDGSTAPARFSAVRLGTAQQKIDVSEGAK